MKFNIYLDNKGRKIDNELCEIDTDDTNSNGEVRLVSYIYQVKVYRNCNGQIPGLKTENPKEYQEIVKVIRKLFKQHFGLEEVNAKSYRIFMQNYKSMITNGHHYEIRKLRNDFNKRLRTDKEIQERIEKIKPSSHGKLLVYFKTPTDYKPAKTTTLTIYRKGSINIDGSIGRQSATGILQFFEKLLKKNPHFLHDPEAESSTESSTSSEFTSSESSDGKKKKKDDKSASDSSSVSSMLASLSGENEDKSSGSDEPSDADSDGTASSDE